MLSYLASAVKTNVITHLIGLWEGGRDKPIVWWESVYITRPPSPPPTTPEPGRTTFSSDFVLPDSKLTLFCEKNNSCTKFNLLHLCMRSLIWALVPTGGLNITPLSTPFFSWLTFYSNIFAIELKFVKGDLIGGRRLFINSLKIYTERWVYSTAKIGPVKSVIFGKLTNNTN